MKDPRDLYREHIVEHSKRPRNQGRLHGHTHASRKSNPLCGDRVTVELIVADDQVAAIRFAARGCAISVAAASMMTEWVEGLGRSDIDALYRQVLQAVKADGPEVAPPANALTALRAFPSREACATLAWDALLDALNESVETTPTTD